MSLLRSLFGVLLFFLLGIQTEVRTASVICWSVCYFVRSDVSAQVIAKSVLVAFSDFCCSCVINLVFDEFMPCLLSFAISYGYHFWTYRSTSGTSS